MSFHYLCEWLIQLEELTGGFFTALPHLPFHVLALEVGGSSRRCRSEP